MPFSVAGTELKTAKTVEVSRIDILETDLEAFCNMQGIPYYSKYYTNKDGKEISNASKRRKAREAMSQFVHMIIESVQEAKPDKDGVRHISVSFLPPKQSS